MLTNMIQQPPTPVFRNKPPAQLNSVQMGRDLEKVVSILQDVIDLSFQLRGTRAVEVQLRRHRSDLRDLKESLDRAGSITRSYDNYDKYDY